MTIFERAKAPIPSFFKKLQFFGLVLTTACGILASGGTIPQGTLLDVIKHVGSAGAVLVGVSQLTVDRNLPVVPKDKADTNLHQ